MRELKTDQEIKIKRKRRFETEADTCLIQDLEAEDHDRADRGAEVAEDHHLVPGLEGASRLCKEMGVADSVQDLVSDLPVELVKTPVLDLPLELVEMPVPNLPVGPVEMKKEMQADPCLHHVLSGRDDHHPVLGLSGQAGEGAQAPAGGADGADDPQPHPVPDLGGVAVGGAQDWTERVAGQDITTNIHIISSSASKKARQCPTKNGPVLRYVGLKLDYDNVQRLIPTNYTQGPLTEHAGCDTGQDDATGGCSQDVQTSQPGTDRQDQGAIQNSSASKTIKCHTKQWPVLRYVGVQSDILVESLITPNTCL
jgi:hypothetical protein